jgi:glycosyltransferase involved in cell wall biosynthesis
VDMVNRRSEGASPGNESDADIFRLRSPAHSNGAARADRSRDDDVFSDGGTQPQRCISNGKEVHEFGCVHNGRPKTASAASAFRSTAHGRRSRIGIEMLGTQTGSRLRGIGRYSRDLIATLIARDTHNEYVLYGQDGLPVTEFPTSVNVAIRLLRPDRLAGESTLAHVMERIAETNPDDLDVLLLLNPLEMTPGYDLPAKPANGLRMAAVVYDLIPLLFQEDHFSLWPGTDIVRRYHQGLNRLRDYDALLAISESTRRDCLSLLGVPPDRVSTVGAASDGRFFVPDRTNPMPARSRALLSDLGITLPFVFSVGSLEYRKNLWGLIDAFAALPDRLRLSHQLVLTYGLSKSEHAWVRQYAADRRVHDLLIVTGRIEDTDLRVLYQRCAAFVFPSLYEGFGLPILEAMHCGALVVAGNNSSQIEVVGDAGFVFNAADSGELAAKLERALNDDRQADELRRRAVARARRFHWEGTADIVLDTLTRPHRSEAPASRRTKLRQATRRRIAFFSPLQPLRSGIADYSAKLIDELKDYYSLDLYHDAGYVPHVSLQSGDLRCFDFRLFARNAKVLGYHALVYQMGNSPYHGFMYEVLLRNPGIVTLHDLGLAGFHFWFAEQPGVDGDAHIAREFEAFFGATANENLLSIAGARDIPGGRSAACIDRGYHLNGRVIEQSKAVVVHSAWSAQQLCSRFPAQQHKTSVVNFGAITLDPAPERRSMIRSRLEIPPKALVVASLGIIHPAKMNVETISAFEPLARAIPEALLILVGVEFDGGKARERVVELGLQQRVRFLGHYPGDLAEIAAITDIGVCLRRPPTNGETSASLMDFLRLGVPTIVSDVGSFSDYPASVVRKHRMDTDGITGLSLALRELADDQSGREAMGCEARKYLQLNHSWSKTGESYCEVIERAVAARGRPESELMSGRSRVHRHLAEFYETASNRSSLKRADDRSAAG